MSNNEATLNLSIWTDEARLKMIKKSAFYPDNKTVYQYGYYDGYLNGYKANTVNKELLEALDNLLKYAAINPNGTQEDADSLLEAKDIARKLIQKFEQLNQ